MSQTIQGKHLPRLQLFKDILDRWVETNIRVAKSWLPYVPWWYNERALLSLFAASVWRADAIAFEEFSTEKRHPKKIKTDSPYAAGRQDLYIEIGRHMFICEAKICWSGMTLASMQPHAHIDDMLDKACSDVRRARASDGERRLGIVFAQPCIRAAKSKFMEERIGTWLKEIRKVEYSCCAWVFPSKGRYAEGGPDLLPGVAVFVREV